ncbi:AAA family ATPase [Chryseobacterium sp. APV1]|uniref:AAA family ATPase n=1 Tax=Chryseobacterium urinae TaxID=3058400 RepID=A0ABT8TZ13_9FLAO|nr:AAA family ATPase [Chryseobacterium sp. APV1]MDO3424039.1 AAA family ATPase [Chryseobacterium sp. APV1]
MKISKDGKLRIVEVILTSLNPFNLTDNFTITDFLLLIWDLENMPSEENRKNALDDIAQHMLRNDDWDLEYLFFEKLNILEVSTKSFINFLNVLISPDIRKTEDSIYQYYFLINPYLEKENLSYYLKEYNDKELPIYTLQKLKIDEPNDINENKIPIFLEDKPSGRSDKKRSHNIPKIFPSMVLVWNEGWNDFTLKTEFNLFFYTSQDEYNSIGTVKIITKRSDSVIEELRTLSKPFYSLNNQYCALGQSQEYYDKLKEILGKNLESFLWAMKDAAFFPDISEKFENDYSFNNSLIRYNEVERLLRTAKFSIYDYDLENLYNFKYKFQPKFAKNICEIDFRFSDKGLSSNRIYALIGKNGTGKTQFMTTLPLDISRKKHENFSPKSPSFSKVIAVSYSAFDSFDIPKKTSSFNYVYCGLRDDAGERITDRGLVLRFHNSRKKLEEQERMSIWVELLYNFIEQDIINLFIIEKRKTYTFDYNGFSTTRKLLSSGQSIILYIITEIVANIRYDSIILYDEPETHLHPNAISQLVNTIYDLVTEFQSYCIVATHSPLIIRDLLSKNVLVIEKEAEFFSVRKLGIETFGENLTVLTDEVFGNREIPKQYKEILRNMVKDGYAYDEVVSKLESDQIPMSLNANIYLSSLYEKS